MADVNGNGNGSDRATAGTVVQAAKARLRYIDAATDDLLRERKALASFLATRGLSTRVRRRSSRRAAAAEAGPVTKTAGKGKAYARGVIASQVLQAMAAVRAPSEIRPVDMQKVLAKRGINVLPSTVASVLRRLQRAGKVTSRKDSPAKGAPVYYHLAQ